MKRYLSYEDILKECRNVTIYDEGGWDMLMKAVLIESLERLEDPIVKCRDCKHRRTDDCPMFHETWEEWNDGDGYSYSDCIQHDNTTDNGFCDKGERI